tara:strand:- start:704196 stop:705386 length:1191 start_codon:yes stop_codon:yes gene_type:complete
MLGIFPVLLMSCETDELTNVNMVTTAEVNFISETKATGGGRIFNGGKSTVNSRGICWGTAPAPTLSNNRTIDGSGDGNFISSLTALQPNTTYYVRAYASNSDGTVYGDDVKFTTQSSAVPILQTMTISNITATSCKSGGSIQFEGASAVTDRGVCWSVNNPPTIADSKTSDGIGVGDFTSSVTGLDSNFSYYVRAYATNSEGTAYGNLLYFKPYKSTVTDIDGNVYTTVSIGSQVWTVENLKVTKYQNGDLIPTITDNALWNTTKSGAFCNYDNSAANTNTYGLLYNWYAASDSRNVAPEGWRVATYEDYQQLVNYLGGPWEAEAKMKINGFKPLPSGKRNRDGNFYDKDVYPYYWTATEYHEGSTWARYLVLDGGVLDIVNLSKNYGFAIRCIRN